MKKKLFDVDYVMDLTSQVSDYTGPDSRSNFIIFGRTVIMNFCAVLWIFVTSYMDNLSLYLLLFLNPS